MIDSKIIVALDYADAASALHLVNQLDPQLCKLKVGKELFTAAGPQLVEQLIAKNFKIFLDLKFHDIPNTVASACRAASDLGVWMLNVHASGGLEMMQAAQAAIQNTVVNGTEVNGTEVNGTDVKSKEVKGTANKPLLIAVTVLTSMNQVALNQTGVTTDLTQHVLNLAHLAKQANLDGVVCSALEAPRLRAQLGEHFCLITPGIRPANTNQNDQSRVVTPVDALKNGASYLVIGRPITQAVHPLNALTAIYNDCQHL